MILKPQKQEKTKIRAEKIMLNGPSQTGAPTGWVASTSGQGMGVKVLQTAPCLSAHTRGGAKGLSRQGCQGQKASLSAQKSGCSLPFASTVAEVTSQPPFHRLRRVSRSRLLHVAGGAPRRSHPLWAAPVQLSCVAEAMAAATATTHPRHLVVPACAPLSFVAVALWVTAALTPATSHAQIRTYNPDTGTTGALPTLSGLGASPTVSGVATAPAAPTPAKGGVSFSSSSASGGAAATSNAVSANSPKSNIKGTSVIGGVRTGASQNTPPASTPSLPPKTPVSNPT
ncbi:MAG: hypothetical protein COY40_06310, partial [Alphaproteobacteria bacterium CG_4_10_14_0_8_um_filter_53_9]